jgi:hypothetical protein
VQCCHQGQQQGARGQVGQISALLQRLREALPPLPGCGRIEPCRLADRLIPAVEKCAICSASKGPGPASGSRAPAIFSGRRTRRDAPFRITRDSGRQEPSGS